MEKVLNFISHFAELQSRHPHFMQPFLISHVEEECYLFLHFPGPTFINFFCGKLQRKVPSSFHLDFLRKNLAAFHAQIFWQQCGNKNKVNEKKQLTFSTNLIKCHSFNEGAAAKAPSLMLKVSSIFIPKKREKISSTIILELGERENR